MWGFSFPWYAASWHIHGGDKFGRYTDSARFTSSRLLVGQWPLIRFFVIGCIRDDILRCFEVSYDQAGSITPC